MNNIEKANFRKETVMGQRSNNDIPLACDFTAMDATQKARHQDLRQNLFPKMEGISELENGYAFDFPVEAELVLALAEFITLEHLCCPFFSFALELETGSGPLQLRLAGGEGVKEFLKTEMLAGHGRETHSEIRTTSDKR